MIAHHHHPLDVPLPWQPQGSVGTKLRQRSAAVVSWLVEIDATDVLAYYGDVPVRLMNEILSRLDR